MSSDTEPGDRAPSAADGSGFTVNVTPWMRPHTFGGDGGAANAALPPTRTDLAADLGSFGGTRDYAKTLGYDKTVTVDDCWERYRRGDIAQTIVDAPAKTAWRERPHVTDDDDTEEETAFEQAIEALFDDHQLLRQFAALDVLAGIGHFGILVIGYADGNPLSEPVDFGATTFTPDTVADAIAYHTPLAENAVERIDLVEDPTDERFGLPEMYTVDFNQGMTQGNASLVTDVTDLGQSTRVHHSRLIHVPSTNTLGSNLFGPPRLEAVWNRLIDLEKAVGSAAELAWHGADYGLVVNMDAEAASQLTADQLSQIQRDVEAELQAWYQGLQPFLRTSGMDVDRLGGETIDPSGIVDVLLKLIAGQTGIPQRILTGSERGELASTQDRATFYGRVGERQVRYDEPAILRAYVDRHLDVGVLPAPTEGSYDVEWPDLFELSELEQVEAMERKSTAISNAANALLSGNLATVGEIRQEVFGWGIDVGSETGEVDDVPDAGDLLPPEPPTPPGDGGEGGDGPPDDAPTEADDEEEPPPPEDT